MAAKTYKSKGELNREKKTSPGISLPKIGSTVASVAANTSTAKTKPISSTSTASKTQVGGKKSSSGLKASTEIGKYIYPQEGSNNVWLNKALELYRDKLFKDNTDSLFDKDYFDPRNNPELEEIFKVDLTSASPLQAAKNIDVMLKYQAGVNYRAAINKEYEFNDSDALYGHNDEGNQNIANNWLQKIKDSGDEAGIRESLDYWKKGIDSASDNSQYKKRLQQYYDDLYKWAGNTYSSFATMEMNDYDTQIARNNIRIRELGAYNNGLSEADATAAQTALGILLSGSGDPIATVQNNKDLRRITDYDNLAKQYSDPYELGDAIIDSLMDFNDRAGSSAQGTENYDEYVRLVEENESLMRGRAEVEERRNSLLEREKYAAMPGTSTSNTSLSHFHPEPYEVATRYSRRNMETGENESFYEYNDPTLAQMVADPEGVWEKYNQAYSEAVATGRTNDFAGDRINDSDLVRRMTQEELDNYKKVYAGYGEEEANKYFDIILRDKLMARQTQQLADEYSANASKNPVSSYLGSFVNNVLGEVGDIANAGRIYLGMEPGQNQFKAVTDAQRGTVNQKLADATEWANFNFYGQEANPFVWLLQGFTAGADEALSSVMFGPELKNVWMGLTAGSAGVVDNYEKYGDRGNAFLSGLGTAAAEFGSEWLGDKVGGVGIFKNMDNLDSGLKKVGYLAKGTIGEGIEEGLSNVIGTGLDAIAGEFTGVGSEVADRIRYLMANGYTQTEAWNVLAKEYTPEVLQDVIVGAIAGAGMSGSNVAATTAYDNSVNRQLGAEIQQQGNVSAVLSMGLQSDDPGVKRVSEMLMKKLNLTDPNQPILPNDSETNAQLNLVKNSVSEEQQAKDNEKKQANAEARMGEDLEEAVQERKQIRTEEQAASDLNKKQAKEEQRAQEDAAKAEQKAAPKEDLNLTRRQKRQVGQVYRKVLNALDVDVEARRNDLRTGIEQKRAELAQDVKEHLRKIGERPIDEVVDAIAAVALDDPKLTIDQLDIAKAYAARKGIVKDLWDVYARTVEQRDTYAAATRQKLDAARMRTADMASEMKARTGEQTITAAGDISYTTDEGDTITGKLESFAAAENGDVAAVVDGKIVPVDRLEIGDEGRDKLLRYAAELRNPDAANAMYEGIEENQDVDAYASGFEAAYHYGEIGIDIAKAKQRATVDMLTPKQFESAYVAGASAAAARPKTVASKVAGKISFADGLDQRLDGLDANQKGAISVMRRFAEVGSVNIEFFESQANAEGSYAEYENGSYNPDTNTIRIDINAGKNKVSDVANYAMLRVASHELTHYIKAQNTEAYQKLQDFVVEHLSTVKNTTFDALVELKMQQQPKLSYEAAVEEVVADGSEMMLKNSTVIQQLAIKDKSLFQRVRDWLRNFAKNVQAAFRGVSARSAEARLLQNVKGMQKLWDNALLGAIENVRSAQVESSVAGTEIDSKTQTASIKNSRRSLEASEYAKDPDKMAASLAKAVNVSEAQAKRYIKNMFSIGKIIAGDQTRLDYEGNPLNSVLKDNAEYKFTVDMSTLCAKRLVYTGTLDAIQNAMPNTVLTSEDLVELRKLMMDRDYEVACGICYVESRRRELGSITKGFVDAYNDALASGEDMMLGPKNNRQAFPTEGGDMLTLADVNTTEGIENIQLNHPKIYAAYMKYMNSRGVSKPKLIETRTDYRGEILDLFNSKRAVKDRNENGGLRIQSFSDFEVVHLIDMMQVITDMAQVGLSGQAYTKVPDFAEAMGRTGLKINLSLIAKGDGVDADGNLIFDDIEGMPADDAFRLRKKYSKNVGTILVGKSDEHIRAALADPRIDFVIPFHKSGWSESLYAKLGLQNYSDYTNFQNERAVIDPDFKWDHSKSDKENYAAINKIRDKGRHVDNLLPMDYWDFNLSGEENARNYLEACYYDGRLPKFPQFVNEPGYWKLLIDFKMYDNNGIGSPQMPVKPDFNMTQARRMLKEYNGGHTRLPVAQDVVDDFVKQYKESHGSVETQDTKNNPPYMTGAGNVKYSARVDDPKVINHLENQEYVVTYRSMQVLRGKLYPPMATEIEGKMEDSSEIGTWEQAVEHPELIKFDKNGKAQFKLDKGVDDEGKSNGTDVIAAYNPYMHSSNLVLNDQFTGAWKRPNLVVVECHVPVSELTSGYHAQYAKDSVGWHAWHAGPVAGKVRAEKGIERKVLLSRYIKPVRILSYYEVAEKYAELLSGTDIAVPDNVVPPKLLEELKKAGIPISQSGKVKDNTKYSIRESSDGYKYVDVDTDQAQFDGLSSSEKRKLAEKIIRSKFVGKVIGTDYKVYVNGTGANEYAYPAKFIQDPAIIDAKMRAAPELENLIDAGFNFRTEKDGEYGHTHTNAVDGFTHFDTVFHVAGEYYIGRINVINGKRGKLFKDLTQIKSIVPDHVGSSGQIALANIVNNASGITVPQADSSVKSSMRTDSPTDRDLLVEAFEGVAQNDNERGYLEKYKGQIEELNEKQIELAKIRREIRDMMFTPGERDSAYKRKLATLKSRANALAEVINRADKRLLMLEKAKPLQDVLARERQKAEKKAAEKRRESLTAMRERRETTEIRHKIRRLADDFNRRLIHPTEKNYIPRDMVHMVIAAQELVDTRSGREGVKAQEKLAQIKAVYDRYKGDSTFSYVYDPMIADMLQKLSDTAGSKNIYQLNKAELTDIYNTLKALRKQVTEAVKLKAGEYAANIFEAGREMYRETDEAAPVANGKKGDFINWQLTPDKFFARLAGYKKGSVWSGVAKSFSDGTERMLEIQREAYYHFRKWTESKEFDKLNDTGDKNLIDIGLKDENGKAVKITRGMMLEVYMHLSSEDNTRGFMYGGFSVPNLKKYYAGKIAESYGTGSVNTVGTSMELAELAEQLRDPDLTEAQQAEIQRQMDEAEQRGLDRIAAMMKTIEGKLTAWDRGLIEAVHRWNDGNSRDHINEVTMDIYGIKRAGVENYYPIHRDKAFVNTDFESISRNVNLENWGSLKDRVPSRAPILLGDIAFTVDTSINQMSRYVGYARAQRDFNKLYNVRMPGMAGSVKKIVGTKFGTGDRVVGVSGEKYLENYIGSITGSRHAESDFLSVIRRNLPRATMTLNARVAFSQLSAIPKAAAEVGWDSVASGLAKGGARAIFSKKAREELAQQNAWFWQRYRGEGGQREFADIKGGTGIIDKAWNKMDDLTKGWLLNWCQDFDIMSTVSMWSMAKEWTRKHTSFKEGTAEFTEAANRKYTDILRNTQAANTVSERSDLARETRPLSILTMYKSEAFANFNMIYDAAARLRKYSRDAKTGRNSVSAADVKQAKLQLINSSISVVVGASLTNAILKLAVNALTSSMNNYRDEDDEITLKSTLTALLNEVLGDIASMVVIGGELYDRFIGSKIFGDAYFAPNDAALSEILDALKYTNEVFEREASVEERMASAQKLFTKVCNMLGVPYNNVKRQAKGLMDTIADIAAGEAFSFEASADRSNGTNYRRMLKASIEGDDTKYASVLAELEENGVELADAQEGYRDKLKEAFEDGEIDRDRAIELMTNYGGKSADDAYWAVDKWEYTGEDNYSKYADLKSALAAGDRSTAAAEVEELLNHGVKEENLASQISTLYGKGEATSILALQLRPGRLYTPSVKEGQEAKKDDFNAFLDAVLAGKGVEEEISKLRSKGYSTKKMMSALNGAFGKSDDRYAIMVKHNPAEANVLEERILDAYVALGLNREQERTWIHENWTMPEEE